jgi:hypothetical protein
MASAPSANDGELHWDVVVEDDLVLRQRVCAPGGPPKGLAPVDDRARAFATAVVVDGDCATVVLRLKDAADGLRAREAAVRASDDVVIASPDVWLWNVSPPRSGTLTLRTAMTTSPARVMSRGQVPWALPFPTSAPVRLEGDAHTQTFRVHSSTWRFLSAGVFGPIVMRQATVPGAVIDVAILPGPLEMAPIEVERWVMLAASAVASGGGGGRFPFPRALVMVEPVWGDGVPFGMVTRGGGPHALLLLGAQAHLDVVNDHWVAVHELAHLLHPLVGMDEPWFGEGLASYQQNILRARVGLLDEAVAWNSLRDGFERGRAASSRVAWSLSVRQASQRMRAEGRWLQTYWGGAAIMLMMDVSLRRCSDKTLDDVVAQFRAAQADVDRERVAAADIVAAAAATAPGCAHIADDVSRALNEPFPSAAMPLLDALGVSEQGLRAEAPLADVRRAIAGHNANARRRLSASPTTGP